MLDATFWEEDYTPVLQTRVPGNLYLDVVLERPQAKNWPAFWNSHHVWALPDLALIAVSYLSNDSWGRLAQYRLVEVNPFFFNEEMAENRVLAAGLGIALEPKHRTHGYWTCRTTDPEGSEFSWGLKGLCRRTEITPDDLEWLFDHWKPSGPARALEWWLEAAKRNLPVRKINPDHVRMVIEAAQRALDRWDGERAYPQTQALER